MKIVVAQFYTNNVPYAKYSTKINEKYCNDNSYIYFTINNSQKIISSLDGRSITWYKPHLIKEVLSIHPDVDYILFLDIDAVITDHSKKIEDFISNDFSIMMTQDYGPSMVNAGVMFVKNDNFSIDFMDKWWEICEEYPQYKTGLWHDQTCIGLLYERLSEKNKFKIVPNNVLNSSLFNKGEFIFHAFSYGNLRNRTIDNVYYNLFQIEPEVDDNSLMELGEVFPTDKHYQHNYFGQVYQDVLSPIKNNVKTLVEVGISDINSLTVFKRFFKYAKVYGINTQENTVNDETDIIKCDQSKPEELNELIKNFSDGVDVILDDGTHKMYDQQITMAIMFNVLKSGGIFIMEDLHTSVECLMPNKLMFGWGDPTKTTTLQMLENYNNTGIIKSDYLTNEQCQYLTDNIESCEIYHLNGGSSITSVIIKK